MYKNIFAIENNIKSFNFLRAVRHKKLWIHYVLWLEMAVKVYVVFLFILLHFSTLYNALTIHRQYTGLQKNGI